MSTFRRALLVAFTLLGVCGVAVSAEAASRHRIRHTRVTSLVSHHGHARRHARHATTVLPPA